MRFFRISYKLIMLSGLAIIAVPVMFFYSFGSDERSPNTKQKAYRKKWLQKVVNVVGLKVKVKGRENSHSDESEKVNSQSALWVANHISWMDIVVVGSQGVGFLSKSEVRKWPFIGWLGEKSGTIFIDRGAKNASELAAKAIAEKINDGDNILVFPEATTTSGENVKRFHARIFAPALDHQLLVQPIAIQYLDDNGKHHPKAVWTNQSFMANMMGVLAQPSINVILTYLPVLDAKHFEQRKELTDLVENQIRDVVVFKVH